MEFQPGTVLWTELMTSDIASAKDFYTKTAGWTFREVDMGVGPYHVGSVGEEMVAGIMGMPEGMEAATPFWISYIGVRDVDKATRDAQVAGAYILQAPFDVPGVGRMVVLQDPQGAQIAFMTPSD